MAEFCPTTSMPMTVCGCANCEPTSMSDSRALTFTTAADVDPKPVRWLVRPLIPLAATTLLGGPEGLGKSTLWVHWAAAATHGALDGDMNEPTNVLVMANEDAPEYTIVPRLMAAGADLTRVHFVDAVSADGMRSSVVMPMDTDRMLDAIDKFNARLVIVDPLVSIIDSSLDSHKDASVRQALDQMNRLASTGGATVLGIVHLNKGSSTFVLDRVLGSRAFTAAARAVIFLLDDPDDDTGQQRLVFQTKSNLGPRSEEALVVRLSTATVTTADGPADVGVVNFVGTRLMDVKDAMNPEGTDDVDDMSDTARWLLDYLANQGGEASRKDVIAAGKHAGYSREQLRKAAHRIGVTSVRTATFPSITQWHHPVDSPQSTQSPRSTQSPDETEASMATGGAQSTQSNTVTASTVSTVVTVATAAGTQTQIETADGMSS